MKVIDKTPLQDEKGEMSVVQRVRGTLEYGPNWPAEMEAQKAIVTQLDRVLEKGFTLIRNITLTPSTIVEPLVLIGPPGVFVIYVTALSGFYEAKGDQWNTVKNGHSSPASKNLMSYVYRLSRALQVYLDRQGITLPGPVEPVLMASSPALHIDSLRPMVRVVLSDAVRQFAASLLQARPVLKPELVFDIADHIVTPRPKVATAEPEPVVTPEYIPPGMQVVEPDEAPARARAIFHAAEDAKPFDPADLEFAFDENAESREGEVPGNLKEPSPSQKLKTGRKGAFSSGQWIVLGGMLVVECCVLAAFVYVVVSSLR
jgi:hypothetical protein